MTPPLCEVTAQASPPSAIIIHTCRSPSFSRSVRNASIDPSGDHSGADALLSPRVYCRALPPLVGTTQTCVICFHSLSFSIFTSLTVYATCAPLGEMRGALTPLIRRRSVAVRSFLPSLARGSGGSGLLEAG